jgi:MFS family permease
MSDPDPSQSSHLAYELPDDERPSTASPAEGVLESQTPGTSAAREHDPYAAWRHRGYRWYSAGWMVAVIGYQMQAVAIGWEVYDRTRDEMALGWLALIQAIPVLLLALPAGHLADRFDRRKIVFYTAILQGLCGLGLAWLSYRPGSLPWMFALMGLTGMVMAVGRPARSALLPQVVPMSVFNNAVTWNSSIFEVSSMVGPALGGAVIAWSVRSAYLLDGVCALIFGIFVLFITARPVDSKSNTGSIWSNLMAGIRFVWKKEIILATITLDLFAVLFGGATYLLPVYAKDILHVDEFGFGLLRAAPAIGAFAMALLLAHLPPMRRAGRNLLVAVALFGVATIVFGWSRWFWLSMGALVAAGAFDNVSVVIRHTLVQVLTPDEMRGRVSAVNQVFIGASNELGGLESGLTAKWFGPVASVVGGGIGTLAVVAAAALCWPKLRRFGSLHDATPH